MTTALDHINRAIQFIERHDGWVSHPGQDLHGWLLQARDAIMTPEPVATTPAFKVGDRVRVNDKGALREIGMVGTVLRSLETESVRVKVGDFVYAFRPEALDRLDRNPTRIRMVDAYKPGGED